MVAEKKEDGKAHLNVLNKVTLHPRLHRIKQLREDRLVPGLLTREERVRVRVRGGGGTDGETFGDPARETAVEDGDEGVGEVLCSRAMGGMEEGQQGRFEANLRKSWRTRRTEGEGKT